MLIYDYLLGICFGAIGALFCAAISLRLAAIVQQCGYLERNFLKWYFSKGNIQRKRISLLTLSLFLLVALFCVCFCFLDPLIGNSLSLIPFVVLFGIYLYSDRKYALKVSANKTPRFVRLAVCHAVLLILLGAGLGAGLAAISILIEISWLDCLRFVPIAILPLMTPVTLAAASLIMKLYETPHNRRFVKRAERMLKSSSCVKVGITGSFGKTSVKHFAAHMLSCKYKVIFTPSSFNTPMGVARTVLEKGLDCDIFLAEMGARRSGDIKELCELVRPTFGVITGVCEQHIETFGSTEAIRREKGELARFAEHCVLGRTATGIEAKDALVEGEDFSVDELVCTTEGSKFTLRLSGESVRLKIGLLGESAAEDVALAAALCHLLGMSAAEIAEAASGLKPVPHRLQKLQGNGVTVLDDAYNSNILGAKNALNTLKLFGGAKYVVTPGLVELGILSEGLNRELGAALVGFEVVLVGETLVLPLRKGYLDAGGDEKRLVTVPTLARAQEVLSQSLRPGDCVLFLNDLPDCYR